jgi:HEAT repeat protein
LLLTALTNYPEITTPAWPWWPPQYEHVSRLLLYLIHHEQIQLEDLLSHPLVEQPAGPVLWISIIETTNFLPSIDYEQLLCEGLETPWITVRYSAAMALATRAGRTLLRRTTLETLQAHTVKEEGYPVRLAASYALLCSNEQVGLEELVQLTHASLPSEVRHAALFVLATDLPAQLAALQREQLANCLLDLLLDPDLELAHQAAHALSKVIVPTLLPALYRLLEITPVQRKILILTVLEEVTQKRHLRYLVRQHSLPTRILPLLKADDQELRRQACYTLAACGGEYVAAVFGTIALNREHPGHVEAIESLRQLRGALRAPMRANVVRWLLRALLQATEEAQLTVVDTLTHLLWQAQNHGCKRAWQEMSCEIVESGAAIAMLRSNSVRIRQHGIELLVALDGYLMENSRPHLLLRQLLQTDGESGVRACITSAYGQISARWAIPELIHTLLDTDEYVARTALRALAHIATPDDALVAYVISELASLYDGSAEAENTLVYEAWMIRKKWRKADSDEVRRKKVAQF